MAPLPLLAEQAWGYDAIGSAIDAFYAENSVYAYGQSDPSNFEQVGHFTQVGSRGGTMQIADWLVGIGRTDVGRAVWPPQVATCALYSQQQSATPFGSTAGPLPRLAVWVTLLCVAKAEAHMSLPGITTIPPSRPTCWMQMVWRGSSELGCAMTSCNGGQAFHVCRYNPPGNVQGQYAQNVFPPQ